MMGSKTTPTPLRELWDIEQVATYLDVTKQFLYDRRYARLAPGNLARKPAKKLVWLAEEVERWLLEGADPHWTPDGKGA